MAISINRHKSQIKQEPVTEEEPTVAELKTQVAQLEKERNEAMDVAITHIVTSTVTLVLLVFVGIKWYKEFQQRKTAEQTVEEMAKLTQTMLEQQVYMMGMMPVVIVEIDQNPSREALLEDETQEE